MLAVILLLLPLCFPEYYTPFKMETSLKGKNLLYTEADSFSFNADTFSEWKQNSLDSIASPEVYS